MDIPVLYWLLLELQNSLWMIFCSFPFYHNG
jgi:hypothetical protein